MKAKEIYMYGLGALVFFSFTGTIALLVFKAVPEMNEKLLYTLLGVLAAKAGDVVSYFFGSSKGSADKTALLAQNANGNNKPTPSG